MHEWVQKLDALTRFLKTSTEPITFIIGAGASLSSGGPTTRRVIEELRASNKHLSNDEELRSHLHKTAETIKTSAIVPLFEHFTPYLGYRALAAIAHQRRVLVLNLNWDMALEQACERIDVRCASADINDRNKIRRALADNSVDVLCVHLHGSLDNNELRFGRFETLAFKEWQKSLLLREFLAHPTIIIGATLRGDTDMVQWLREIERRRGKQQPSPVWLLTPDKSVIEDRDLLRMLAARDSEPNAIYDPRLDFDRALIWINAQLCGFTFESFAAMMNDSHALDVKNYEQIVLPRPELLRSHLDKDTIVLRGEPRLGKTTIAHFLGFFFHSLRRNPCSIDPATRNPARPRSVFGPSSCASMVGSAKPEDVLILEDPFGATERFEANPAFLRALRTGGSSARQARIIVTSRPSTWNRGIDESAKKQPQRDLFAGDIGIVTEGEEWYAPEELAVLIPPDAKELAQRIASNDLNTPARILDAVKHTSFAAIRSREVVQEKIEIFRLQGLNVQRVAALVRLQQMSSHTRTWDRILEDARIVDPEELETQLVWCIKKFVIDGQTYARLRHPTDIEAIDQLLASRPLSDDIRDVAKSVQWLKNALAIRSTIRDFHDRGYTDPLEQLSTDQLAEWAPTFLAASGVPEVIGKLDRDMDSWALRDYVYEIVRLWPDLRKSKDARDYLDKLLRDRRRQGVYAVLEAALYLQRVTHPEIWSRLENELWNLYEAHDENRENVALVFDAMFWRSAPDNRIRTDEWVERLIHNVDSKDPLRGAFVFTLVFHANATSTYFSGETNALPQTLDMLGSLDDKQVKMFCWMLHWHYMHECRDRALVQRRDQLPDEFLIYLRRTTFEREASENDRTLVHTTCERLGSLGQPGAAFLLALNLSAMLGDLNLGPLLRQFLAAAPPDDPYVILAAMTYSPLPADIIDDARAFFERPESRKALLNAFARGVVLDGVTIEWPRFDACRDAFKVMHSLHVNWHELDHLGVPLQDRATFMGWLKKWRNRSADPSDLRRFMKRLGRGDLRPLWIALTQVPEHEDRLQWAAQVVARAMAIVQEQGITVGELPSQSLPSSVANLPWYTEQLRIAKASQNRPHMQSAIEEILRIPQQTSDEQRLRAEALLLRARNALLDDRPNVEFALESAREARRILMSLGQRVEHDDEQIHKQAILAVDFPPMNTTDRVKLLGDSVEVLERTAELLRTKSFKLPQYSSAKAARRAVHRFVAFARGEAMQTRQQPPAEPLPAPLKTPSPDRLPVARRTAGTTVPDAETLAGQYLVGVTSPPTALEAMFPRLKIKRAVEVAALATSGELRQEGDEWLITYAANESATRKKFTIAHEVAHAIVKTEFPWLRMKRDDEEQFCDALAAAILMPKKLFTDALGTPVTLDSLHTASSRFGVSIRAAAIRCEELTGCQSFQVQDGRVDWATRHVPSKLPMLREVVRNILTDVRDIEPLFLTTKRYSGFWSVEFNKQSQSACTVFLRPLPLGHSVDRPPEFT